MQYKNHIMSQNSIIVFTDDSQLMVTSSSKTFPKIRTAILNRRFDEAIDMIRNITKIKVKTKQIFTMRNGIAYFKGEAFPKVISDILKRFADNNIPATAMVNFWLKLKKNPREFSRNELYLFLEHNGIPLCEDGDFITYKSIRDNYRDCHSNTIDNHPGAKIPRLTIDEVQTDRRVCSDKGYHVCSWGYLPTMRIQGGTRTVECKVNPADVVSIPNDHGNAKMRVTFYQVIREITGSSDPNPEILYHQTELTKKSKQRIIIPASFLKMLKCKPGSNASVVIGEGKIEIFRGKRGQNVYTVEEDSAIRIAKCMLEKAGILSCPKYILSAAEDHLVLKGE